MNQQLDLEIMREATQISMQILKNLIDLVEVGVTPAEIDIRCGEFCVQYGVEPAFFGVTGAIPYPANMCIGVNEEVLHAIPSENTLREGDLVKLDFGIVHKGHYTDHCVTVGVKSISDQDRKLVEVAKLAVEKAVSQVAPGVPVGNLGYTMQQLVKLSGFDVLKQFVGHGIGTKLHLPPEIPAYGKFGEGQELKVGQVICVEAQVVAGTDDFYIDDDQWTIKTADGKKGVMFEYMVLVTEQGHEILTDTTKWPTLSNK